MRSFPASAMYLQVFLVTSHLSFFLGFVLVVPPLAPPAFPPQPVQLAIPHCRSVMTETRLENSLEETTSA